MPVHEALAGYPRPALAGAASTASGIWACVRPGETGEAPRWVRAHRCTRGGHEMERMRADAEDGLCCPDAATGADRVGGVPVTGEREPRVVVGVSESITGLQALRQAVIEAGRRGAALWAVRV